MKGTPSERPPGKHRLPKFPSPAWWIVLLTVMLLFAYARPLVSLLGFGPDQGREVPYTAFRTQLKAGNVSDVSVRGERIRGRFKQAVRVEAGGKTDSYGRFTTYVPSFGDPNLLALLEEQGVQVRGEPKEGSPLWVALASLLPVILFIGLAYFLLKRLGGEGQQMLSMGKSRARMWDLKEVTTTFADVAGAEGAKRELGEVIDFLKDPERFRHLGGSPPKGVLLVGPPGTGKTLLARAVAGEAGAPFLSISGSDFMEMFVGVGASRVRDLFSRARKAAPAIVFIDELDSIGRRRGAGMGGSHDEREQTLNQLLAEMDGFEAREGAIVMAATNRPDVLDPALLRPGRFDRQVMVELPGVAAREEILRVHARGKRLAADVELGRIARGTPGFSGADLANLLNEAALIAVRRGKDAIGADDIDAARDKILLGLEREGVVLNPEELRLLAYHEGGHAVVAVVVPNADMLHKVTIVPRGRAMGVTHQIPEKDRYIYSREYMLDRMAVMMGGRAAESLVFQTATTGAENDLKETAKLARRMVVDWGMSERLSNLALRSAPSQAFLGDEVEDRREYSESTAREVDEEVKRISDEAYQRACRILQDNRVALDGVVAALLEREEVAGQVVVDLVRGGGREAG